MKNSLIAAAVLGILVLVLIFNSFYIVDETEQVIILQMGEYKKTVTEPGLHAKMPLIQSVKS